MNKSSFCQEHFSMNCKLCSAAPEAPAQPSPTPTIIPPRTDPKTPEEYAAMAQRAREIAARITGDVPSPVSSEEVHGPVGFSPVVASPALPPPPVVHSEEATAVISITDQYAKACDEVKAANDSVKNMEDHLAKMTTMLTNLKTEAIQAKQRRDELKRKVLETLAMGNE
jgi:hypothetical protein